MNRPLRTYLQIRGVKRNLTMHRTPDSCSFVSQEIVLLSVRPVLTVGIILYGGLHSVAKENTTRIKGRTEL
jgi:hypothetical protein